MYVNNCNDNILISAVQFRLFSASGGSDSDSSGSSDEEEDVHKTHKSRRGEWEQDISKVNIASGFSLMLSTFL